MPIILKLFLALSVLATVSAKNAGPLYLCDAISREAHFETAYFALDQCTRWGTDQLRHNSFALRFQLTGKCENGFTICYPGSLDPSGANSAFGMSPAIQVQVQNLPESELGNQCLAYQKKCNNKNNKANHCEADRVWHGIRVSAPKASGVISIEMSISTKRYNISSTNQIFSIEFGNSSSLMTKVTDKMGREIKFLDDDSIRDAYFVRKIRGNAKLSNYVGLWMLGLDLLPVHSRDTLQLHVDRDCGCEMHAWFVHPSDEMPPLRSEPPEVSDDCPTASQIQQFALQKTANIGRAIHLRQRLNKRPKGVVLRFGNEWQRDLLVLAVDKPPYGLINITSEQAGVRNTHFEDDDTKLRELVMGGGGGQKRKGGKGPFKSLTADGTDQSEEEGHQEEAKRQDKYMDVEVVVHKYFYEVKVGDRKSVNYFPVASEWWEAAEDKMGNITHIEITGDVYPNSIDEPKVKEKAQQMNESRHSKLQFYSTRFDNVGLDVGFIIVIKGKTGTPPPEHAEDGLRLNFYLMHNTPSFNRYVSRAAWYLIQWRGNLSMGHYNYQEKFCVDPKAKLNVFEPNEPFEMRIEMTRPNKDEIGEIKITVFAPNRTDTTTFKLESMAFRDINYINIIGYLELFAAPQIIFPDDYAMHKKNAFHVFPLLVAGDSLKIEGKLRDDAKEFKIYFLHDSPVPNPYLGNVVMQIVFDLKMDNGTMLLNTLTSNKKQFTELSEYFDSADLMKIFPSKMFPGEEFKIEIRVEFNEYKILVYGALAGTYEHVMPSWAVSYLNFHGQFASISKFVLDRSKGIFRAKQSRSLKLPFVLEVSDKKMLKFGDVILIDGTVNSENATITILLLNEALETYKSVSPSAKEYLRKGHTSKIGIIIASAVFFTDSDGKGRVEFAYNDEEEGKELHEFKPALSSAQKFHLKVSMDTRLKFHLDGHGTFVYKRDSMPVWAIQYIRIEGDLELSKMPQIEVISRKTNRKQSWLTL